MQTENHNSFLNIREIPFEVDAGIGARARIGVIVLATDHTIEHEFRQIVGVLSESPMILKQKGLLCQHRVIRS